MQLDDVVRWSRRHSGAAAVVVGVLVAGTWVRVAGPAGAGSDVLFATSALGLVGALVSWARPGLVRMPAVAVPGVVRAPSRQQRQEVVRLVRRGRPLDEQQRHLARHMAGSQLGSGCTLVWVPLLIGGSQATGLAPLDPREPSWWVSVVLVIAAALLEAVVQHDGHRWRVAATQHGEGMPP